MKTLKGENLFALLTLLPPVVAFCNDSRQETTQERRGSLAAEMRPARAGALAAPHSAFWGTVRRAGGDGVEVWKLENKRTPPGVALFLAKKAGRAVRQLIIRKIWCFIGTA